MREDHLTLRLAAIGSLMGLALVAFEAAADSPKFTSTWKAPDAAGVSFAGKKVAALVISTDQNLRVSGEEQLVRELEARGVQGVATYRMAPKEELASSERARPWFERAGAEGVVALRPVSAEVQRTYSPSVWTQPAYSTLWGYYGYGWTSVYAPGAVRDDTVLVVETLIYSVPKDTLLWAGVSTTVNPKEAQGFISQLVGAAVKEMRKERIVK